jgi:hypothetical protein
VNELRNSCLLDDSGSLINTRCMDCMVSFLTEHGLTEPAICTNISHHRQDGFQGF